MEAWSLILPMLMIVVLLIAINSAVKRGQKITQLESEKAELQLQIDFWQQKYQQAKIHVDDHNASETRL